MRYFDVTEEGNVEDGKSILHVVNEAEKLAHFLKMEPGDLRNFIRSARTSLFARRASRTAPFLDEKVVTSWNGLMISAMAKGFQISGREEFLVGAQQAAEFILSEMMSGDRLFHIYKDGRARLIGLQDDYSFFAVGLLDLFEVDFNNGWLEAAARISQTMVERFWDEQNGGFFYTEAGESDLIVRTLHVFGKLMSESPTGCSNMISAFDMLRESLTEIVIMGEGVEKANMLRTIYHSFLPNKVLVTEDATADCGLHIPLLEGKTANGLQVAAFVCRNQACSAPISSAAELEKHLFPGRAD